MKKIALCSSVMDRTTIFANKLMRASGLWFISFKDVIEEWLANGGKVLRKSPRPLGFILPALEYLKKEYGDMGVVLFGADTLVHEQAEREIKKEYELVFLHGDGKDLGKEVVEQVLHKEYNTHLGKIADVVVDCSDMKKAVAQIKKLMESVT